jgi:hypothetical protein
MAIHNDAAINTNRHAREGGHPEGADISGFPPSRE